MEDLRVHPKSKISEIAGRLPEVDLQELRKMVYSMVDVELITEGARTCLLYTSIFQVLFASKKEADAAVANRCCKNCYHYAATQGTCQHTGNHHANPEREQHL